MIQTIKYYQTMAKSIPYSRLFNLIGAGKLAKFQALLEQHPKADLNIQDEV